MAHSFLPSSGYAGEDAAQAEAARFVPTSDWRPIAEAGFYQAYAKDLDFMWRWIIVRDGSVIQEGCSISLDSSARAARQVFAFYAVADVSRLQATSMQ